MFSTGRYLTPFRSTVSSGFPADRSINAYEWCIFLAGLSSEFTDISDLFPIPISPCILASVSSYTQGQSTDNLTWSSLVSIPSTRGFWLPFTCTLSELRLAVTVSQRRGQLPGNCEDRGSHSPPAVLYRDLANKATGVLIINEAWLRTLFDIRIRTKGTFMIGL